MTPDVRRGQLWGYVAGSQRYQVVIVSTDDYNVRPDAVPWGLAVVRATGDSSRYVVGLPGSSLGASARIAVPYVMRCQPLALRDFAGYVDGETFAAVEAALRDFLDL